MEKSKEKRRYQLDSWYEAVDVRNANSGILEVIIKRQEVTLFRVL